MTAVPNPAPPVGRRHRRRGRVALVIAALLLVYPAGSYVRALTYPGSAGFAVRSIDWLRDMGLGGLVNAVENWWYTRHPPTNAAPAPTELPSPPVSRLPVTGPRPDPIPPHPGAPAGAGAWTAGARSGGQTVEYTTFIQPDPRHASVVAGVAWLNQDLVRTQLFSGTKDPRGPGPHAVPAPLLTSLVAVFNSGFKLKDSNGGVYLDGTAIAPLRAGKASVVIDDTGRVSIVQWGRDTPLRNRVAAVRQNLDLVVDHGKPVPGLDRNPAGAWGSAANQYQYTWRSGLGTDRAGNLVYVAGNGLTLDTLAAAMTDAGIQQGMELDIHSPMVTFNSYRPDLPGAHATKLLPHMPGAADRYLQPDQRDFFAVTLRSPVNIPRNNA